VPITKLPKVEHTTAEATGNEGPNPGGDAARATMFARIGVRRALIEVEGVFSLNRKDHRWGKLARSMRADVLVWVAYRTDLPKRRH
jgi:hypothetical protein